MSEQWALFKGKRQVSKAHTTRAAVMVEAYEKGVVFTGRGEITLSSDYRIERLIK